jgi:hypothetical protein
MEGFMADQNALFVQAVFAFSQGASGSHISPDACQWFHARYHSWLGNPSALNNQAPLDVWDTEGTGFLAKFKEIGEEAKNACDGVEIQQGHVESGAKTVESASKCPHCPDPIGG